MTQRNISITLQCLVKKDGKYLMLRRNPEKRIMPDVWMAPGGHREFCEGVFEAARREIMEETGLEIKNMRIRGAGVAFLKDLQLEVHFHFLTAEYAGGELISNPEDGELAWLESKEILTLDNLLSELKDVLPHALSDDPRTISYKATYEKGNEMIDFQIENG